MAIGQRAILEQPRDLAEYEIESVTDPVEALRRAQSTAERVVIEEGGEPVAAVIPIQDLYLLLRLEDEELDRIDLEEIEKREADPNQDPIPWDVVKTELVL
jgi:hypothetical protein